MLLLRELLSDWVGILSLATILAVIVMAGYYGWLFMHKVDEETRAHRAAGRRSGQRGRKPA